MNNLNEEEIKELETSLKRHSILLTKFLHDPKKIEHELYLPIAGQLRVLLCDRNLPILIKYAEIKRIPLPIFAPSLILPSSENKLPLLSINFLKIGWSYRNDNSTISIQEFLDKPYGIVPIKNSNGSSKGSMFTPKQIIKWVANKEGIAHLDFKKPATLISLNNFVYHSKYRDIVGALVQKIIFELARWTIVAISWVLCFKDIKHNVYKNLKRLRPISEISPKKLPLIAHYKLLENNLKTAYLEGEHILETPNMEVHIKSGFSWNAMIKLVNQINSGQTYIYEIGGDTSKISIYLDGEGNLNFVLTIKDGNVFTITLEQIVDSHYFDNFIFLSCQICIVDDKLKLILVINSEQIRTKEFYFKYDIGVFTKQVLGGNLEGRFKSSFILRELTIAEKCLTKNEVQGLAKYLWNEWIRDQIKRSK